MDQKILNRLELVNDILVFLTAYSMILFTDFVPSILVRIVIGDVFITLVFTVIGINALAIIYLLAK